MSENITPFFENITPFFDSLHIIKNVWNVLTGYKFFWLLPRSREYIQVPKHAACCLAWTFQADKSCNCGIQVKHKNKPMRERSFFTFRRLQIKLILYAFYGNQCLFLYTTPYMDYPPPPTPYIFTRKYCPPPRLWFFKNLSFPISKGGGSYYTLVLENVPSFTQPNLFIKIVCLLKSSLFSHI